jgi:lipopolysaccharide export system permease protein
MRACGISLWKIVQPLMGLALFFSFLLLLVNEFIVPFNAKALNDLLEVKLKGKTQLSLKRDEIWYRDNNRIINIQVANPKQQKLHGVTIFTLDDKPQITLRQEAQNVNFSNDQWTTTELTERYFESTHGDLEKILVKNNQQLYFNRSQEEFFAPAVQNSTLNFQQLLKRVNKLEIEGIDSTKQRVDMHTRLAAPFTCLIMGFLGIPFALQRGRNSNIALGIGLSLGIGVAYFILQSLVTAFGYTGALPPVITAWATNTIFLMLGVWMLLSVKE